MPTYRVEFLEGCWWVGYGFLVFTRVGGPYEDEETANWACNKRNGVPSPPSSSPIVDNSSLDYSEQEAIQTQELNSVPLPPQESNANPSLRSGVPTPARFEVTEYTTYVDIYSYVADSKEAALEAHYKNIQDSNFAGPAGATISDVRIEVDPVASKPGEKAPS